MMILIIDHLSYQYHMLFSALSALALIDERVCVRFSSSLLPLSHSELSVPFNYLEPTQETTWWCLFSSYHVSFFKTLRMDPMMRQPFIVSRQLELSLSESESVRGFLIYIYYNIFICQWLPPPPPTWPYRSSYYKSSFFFYNHLTKKLNISSYQMILCLLPISW